MLSPIRAQCLLALFCLGGWAMRTGIEELDASIATEEAADAGAESAVAVSSQHAAEHEQTTVPMDKEYFVFVEVYELKGTGISQISQAISGFNIADNLLQVGENASGAQRRAAPHQSEATGGDNVADNLLQVADNASVALYHSEVIACPRSNFQPGHVDLLTKLVAGTRSFAEVPEDAWAQMQVMCLGSSWAAGGTIAPRKKSLSARRAGIGNADTTKVWKYFYGTSGRAADEMAKAVRDVPCPNYWRPQCYHPVAQNCNFFVNVALYCGFGLSASMPPIHVSGIRKITTCNHCLIPQAWCK